MSLITVWWALRRGGFRFHKRWLWCWRKDESDVGVMHVANFISSRDISLAHLFSSVFFPSRWNWQMFQESLKSRVCEYIFEHRKSCLFFYSFEFYYSLNTLPCAWLGKILVGWILPRRTCLLLFEEFYGTERTVNNQWIITWKVIIFCEVVRIFWNRSLHVCGLSLNIKREPLFPSNDS